MTRGAGILPLGRYAFSISAGLPSVEAMFVIPVSARLEVNPIVRFSYMFGTSLDFQPALSFGPEIKFNAWHRDGHDIALVFDILVNVFLADAYLESRDGFNLWIGGIDFRYSHRWDHPRVGVLGGFRCAVFYLPTGGRVFQIPLEGYTGVEFAVASGVTLHVTGRVGVDIAWGMLAGFLLGVSYAW